MGTHGTCLLMHCVAPADAILGSSPRHRPVPCVRPPRRKDRPVRSLQEFPSHPVPFKVFRTCAMIAGACLHAGAGPTEAPAPAVASTLPPGVPPSGFAALRCTSTRSPHVRDRAGAQPAYEKAASAERARASARCAEYRDPLPSSLLEQSLTVQTTYGPGPNLALAS